MRERAVRRHLDELIRQSGSGYAEISRLIGRNPAYVQQFIKRGVPKRLGEVERRLLATHFGVSETLLGGPDDATLQPQPTRHPIVDIPYLAPPDGAPARVSIDGKLIARIPAARTAMLAAFMVNDDAMATTFLAGDQLLIDQGDAAPARDGLYLLEGDGGPVVKRLSINPVTHRVAILSDNAAYPSFPDCSPQDIRVLGRVVWVSRAVA
jgi:hypothetical protein